MLPKPRRHGGSIRSVEITLYHAPNCHLCERARETLARLAKEIEFELVEVDITDDPELEQRYREWLPVVEIDGERAFVYTLDEAALRRRLSKART